MRRGLIMQRIALVSLSLLGFVGCHGGENTFGLRGRQRTPYVAERPVFDGASSDRFRVSGYAGFNYGPAPIIAPAGRPAR
jgi:hypothetical protein